jgi:hypothetical protein
LRSSEGRRRRRRQEVWIISFEAVCGVVEMGEIVDGDMAVVEWVVRG